MITTNDDAEVRIRVKPSGSDSTKDRGVHPFFDTSVHGTIMMHTYLQRKHSVVDKSVLQETEESKIELDNLLQTRSHERPVE